MPIRNDPGPPLVVGVPGDQRVALLQAALQRCGLQPARVLSYVDLLTRRAGLEPCAWVRLEAPGRDLLTERHLLALGAEQAETEQPSATWISAADALQLPQEHGRLRFPRQWYRGYRALLLRLAREGAALPGTRFVNAPEDIAAMFDKLLCQEKFEGAGVPVPARLGPVRDFGELMERLRATGHRRVFVKLAHASSASGAVALALGGNRVRAATTVEMVRKAGDCRLYNSRRICIYESWEDVAVLCDALCREGVQVEEWVPKAGVAGHVFDLRVLVIAGRPRHVVVRMSRTPLTNLHLLNPRGDVAEVRRLMTPDAWEAALAACTRAAQLFPRSHYAGVDLVFAPRFRRHAVVEINAFGDLLPGVSCDGEDTYEAELRAWAPRPPCAT